MAWPCDGAGGGLLRGWSRADDRRRPRTSGVATEPLTPTRRAAEVDAFAKVLDPEPLVQLASDLATAEAAAVASSAEAQRAKTLHATDGSIAAKDMEAAVAQARSDALKVEMLRSRLDLEWGPGVARMSHASRARLVRGVVAGQVALVHIDIGQQRRPTRLASSRSTSATCARALALARAAVSTSQSSGLIVEVTGRSAILLSVGLTQSAHIEQRSPQSGFVVRAAIIRFKGSTGRCARDQDVRVARFCRRQSPRPTASSSRKDSPPASEWSPAQRPRRAVRRRTGRVGFGALSMLAKVVRWSLERPRLVAWFCAGFLIWGTYAARDMPIDLLPDLDAY